MADKKQPPWQGDDDKVIDAEEMPADSRRFGESKRHGEDLRRGEGRRRLPMAALVVLLALVAIGVYVAWPSIQESMQPSPPNIAAPEITADSTAQTNAPVPLPPDATPDATPTPVAIVPAEPSPAILALAEQVAALQKALTERAARLVPETAPAAEADLTPLTDALAGAMARVEMLEQRLSESLATPPPDADSDAAAARAPDAPHSGAITLPETTAAPDNFRTLERLDDLEDALRARSSDNSSAVQAEIESLRNAQAALQQELIATRQSLATRGQRETGDGQTMLLVLALNRLTRATATALPFAREVESLRAAIQAEGSADLAIESAIKDLAAHALGGVPTAAGLGAGFDDMALAVIHADSAAEDQGWIDATIGRLRRIVTIRRVGGKVAADSLEGRLSALHDALLADDLAAAIAVGEALPAKAGSGATNWLQGARARLAVENALNQLEQEVAERVATRWSAPQSGSKSAPQSVPKNQGK